MGSCAQSDLFYGFMFPEECEFPWGDCDFEEWWYTENTGLEYSDYSVFEKFNKENPFPFSIVWTYSYDYSELGLAVNSSHKSCSCSCEDLGADFSLVVDDKEVEALKAFCKKYLSDVDGCPDFDKPSWHLTALYG